MTFLHKCEALRKATAQMESSKTLCLHQAVGHFQCGNPDLANERLEKGAQYAWGFNRPAGWHSFKVGQRARYKGSYLSPSRRGRIAEITTNHLGTTIYVFADGGRFGAEEIEAD